MSYQLNDKITGLKPYEPITGEYPIRLDANESFLQPSAIMRAKISMEIVDGGLNRYPDPLCKKACKAFADYYNIDAANVTAGNGSDELLMLLPMAFLKKNERMLVFEPDFSMYKFYSYLTENQVICMPKKKDLTIDLDAAAHLINEQNIKAVVFSNPCNPTSLGISRQQIIDFIKSVGDCLVIVDEAYMDFWDSYQSIVTIAAQFDNVICLRTMSKAIGMAGIRMGFAVANKTITQALRSVKSPYNCNSLSQTAAEIILSDKQYIDNCIDTIKQSRDYLYNKAIELFAYRPDVVIYPTCTNFIFILAPDAEGTYELLRENGVVVRLMGNYLRVTAGTQEENDRVLELLRQFL